MKRKIRALAIPHFSTKWLVYQVGDTMNGRAVAEIQDNCTEYDDHVFTHYAIKDAEGNTLAEVMNCPVILEYEVIVQ